jgi:hypothetical protein
MACGAVMLLGGALAGCSQPRPSAAAAAVQVAQASPLYHGELVEYVPAAGLRWLLVGSPAQLAHWPALAPLRQRWLTAARLDAFSVATGVDLTRTRAALLAGFDLGTLYLADGSGWTAEPELAFVERLAGSAIVQQPQPGLWRVSGLVGSTPETLVRVDHHLLAVTVGDPTPARVVELRARGRLARVPSAFEGAALSGLPPELLRAAPLRFYALGPFEGEWLAGAQGLLAGAEAVALMLQLDGEGMCLRLALAGYWEVDRDRERLSSAWRALATSPLGHALALDRPRRPVALDASERYLSLEVRLEPALLVAGVDAVLGGDVERLLPLPAPPAPR